MTKKSTRRAEAIALIKLAAPVTAAQLGQMVIGTTDVMMLGALSKEALASAALGFTFYFSGLMLGTGPASAVAPLIARHLGKNSNDQENPRVIFRMAMWAVLLMAVPIILLISQTERFLLFLGEPSDLSRNAGQFVKIMCLGLPFALCFQTLRGYVTAFGRPGTVLVVTVLTIIINAISDYALIFGHFGLPSLGIAGAAMASACSLIFSFSALLFIIRLIPDLWNIAPLANFFHFKATEFYTILRQGVPIGFSTIFEVTFFNLGALIAGHFGAAVIAANQIALNVASLTFMLPLGIGTAASVRVGLMAGSGNIPGAHQTWLTALAMGGGMMGICGIVLAIWPQHIASLYVGQDIVDRNEVIGLAVIFLRFAAMFQLFDSLQVISIQSLRGLKDVAIPMIVTGVSYWLIGFPLSLFLSFTMNWRGSGIWGAFCISLFFAAAGLILRFLQLSRKN